MLGELPGVAQTIPRSLECADWDVRSGHRSRFRINSSSRTAVFFCIASAFQ